MTRETGAVVLERDEQYWENGLNAPTGGAAETPEPATWILTSLALAVMLKWRRDSHRTRSPHA